MGRKDVRKSTELQRELKLESKAIDFSGHSLENRWLLWISAGQRALAVGKR